MNDRDTHLLRMAKDERDITHGFITDNTRDRLSDLGYTAAGIEEALLNMESKSNGF